MPSALVPAFLLCASGPAASLTPPEPLVLATDGVTKLTLKQACKKGANVDKASFRPMRRKCYDIDVVVANQGDLPKLGGGEFNQLLTNDGSGAFTATRLPPGPTGMVFDPATGEITLKPGAPTTSAAVALADVDDDGDLDVFVANHGFIDPDDFTIFAGESNVLLRNKGRGTFTAKALDRPVEVRNSTAVAAGDLDNDGDVDFLVGNDGNPVQMYTNDGKGHFTVTDVTAGSGGVFADLGPVTGEPLRSLHIALGDLNGDRLLDALVAYDGDPNHVLINNGDGTFAATFIENPPFTGDEQADHPDSEGVAIADLDGDGDLDGLFANDGEGVELVRNDGSGNFTREHVEGTEGSSSKAIVIGDFDGDGDFDALVANTTEAKGTGIEFVEFPQLLRNNGDGTFVVSTVGRATRGETVAAADFDSDGDLDALIGNVTVAGFDAPHPNYMLRNDGLDGAGNIIFTAVDVAGGPRVTDGFAVGDVDGDGIIRAVDHGLPNINPDDLLPEMFPHKGKDKKKP